MFVCQLRRDNLLSSSRTSRERNIVGGLPLPSSSLSPREEQIEEDCGEGSKFTRRRARIFARRHQKPTFSTKKSTQRRKRPKFSLYSHKPIQVASTILSFLPNLKVNISEIDKAFAYIRKYEEMRKRPNQNPEDPDLLEKYLHLFDKMYFCGALRDLVYVEIGQRGFEGLGKTDYGDFNARRSGKEYEGFPGFEGRIRISNLNDLKKFSDPEFRLHHYLGTLLHEAIHAIFDMYICYKHQSCNSLEWEFLAKDGHGKLFTQVAESIEAATEILHKGKLSIV